MPQTYILHSARLDKFYIGTCHGDLGVRIENHNYGKYSSKTFAFRMDDWVPYLKTNCEDYPHAIHLECKIKTMKSMKYIENFHK